MASFRRAAVDDTLATAVMRDVWRAPLAAPDRALVRLATDLTYNPRRRDIARVEQLRRAGFDDAAVLCAVQITAFVNFENRVANGLLVELESKGEARSEALLP